MAHKGIVVFTGKCVDTLLRAGGSGVWTLSPARASRSEYVVCTWNAHNEILRETEDAEHGAAFLVAPITGLTPEKRTPIPGRKKLDGYRLDFRRYARIHVPGVWPGRRNPFTYVDDVEAVLGRRLDSLRWAPLPSGRHEP
jgi:hypothetical protein